MQIAIGSSKWPSSLENYLLAITKQYWAGLAIKTKWHFSKPDSAHYTGHVSIFSALNYSFISSYINHYL